MENLETKMDKALDLINNNEYTLAQKELKEILSNEPENIVSRNMCERLGAELTDIDEHCHYWLRK